MFPESLPHFGQTGPLLCVRQVWKMNISPLGLTFCQRHSDCVANFQEDTRMKITKLATRIPVANLEAQVNNAPT
jgi:hypothetical protein